MLRWIHYFPSLLGVSYAVTGTALALQTGQRDWLQLLTALAAVLSGVWTTAAAQSASDQTLRRVLIALGFLAPVTLLPLSFHFIPGFHTLRLLGAAAAFDALWSLSSPGESTSITANPWWRKVWITFNFGGAFSVSLTQWPWFTFPLGWCVLSAGIVVVTSIRRVKLPYSLLQESAAHHALWSIFAASVAALSTLGLVGYYPELIIAVGATVLTHGISQATEHLHRHDTSFSMRNALAPLLVAGLFASGCYLAALQGSQWSTAAVIAALFAATLFTAPLAQQIRALLECLPPRSASLLEEAVRSANQALTTNPDLEELIATLAPVAAALPRGAVALVSFEPDWTVVLSDGKIEQRPNGPGTPLRDILVTPAHVKPLLAERVVDRSVRETNLRPAAELIDELGTQLIVPLPGGPAGELAGALLVGLPSWGPIRGRAAANLDILAQRLGPQLKAAVIMEQAGVRIRTLEQQTTLKEDQLERLEYQIERLKEENRLLRADRAGTMPQEIVGRSQAMKNLLHDIEKAATIETSLLIRGESGTGRTLVARTIHESSAKREGPLVQFDCAGIPQATHLKTLVGHTDGNVASPGLVELAHQGTLLLQEVGALSLEAQAEIVRVLASGEVSRITTNSAAPALRPVEIRVIGSTGRISERALERDALLPEFYARLRAVEIHVPPLRERRGDIPELAQFFLDRATRRHGLDITDFTQESMIVLEEYHWPGNVRQLRAVIEHAALYSGKGRIALSDLPPLTSNVSLEVPVTKNQAPLDGTFEDIERTILEHALKLAQGNKAEAARKLGLKRTTFASRLRKLGL